MFDFDREWKNNTVFYFIRPFSVVKYAETLQNNAAQQQLFAAVLLCMYVSLFLWLDVLCSLAILPTRRVGKKTHPHKKTGETRSLRQNVVRLIAHKRSSPLVLEQAADPHGGGGDP